MKIALVISLAVLALAQSNSCTSFTCGDFSSENEGKNGTSRICGMSTPDGYKVQNTCEPGYVCSLANNILTVDPPSVAYCIPRAQYNTKLHSETNRLPGDICSSSDQCYSNNCLDGVCKALNGNQGAACSVNADCSAGLRCGSGKCIQASLVDQPCQADSDCTYGNYCF